MEVEEEDSADAGWVRQAEEDGDAWCFVWLMTTEGES